MSGNSCTGVKSVADLKKKVNSFPKPKTEEITIEDSNLGILEPGIFQGFTALTAIYMSGNDIKEIKEGTFEGLASLKYLYLNNNNIERLETHIFKGLLKLCELDLSGNKLTFLPEGCFTEFAMTANSACLNLSNNKIERIEPGALRSLTVLDGTLDLSNNCVTKLTSHVFVNLLIEKFDISNNKISAIEDSAFEGCNLKFLHLERNCIADIHPTAFVRCEIQSEFHLEGNKIASFDGIFKTMRHLKELYLDNNGLSTFPNDCFKGLEDLDTLSLNKNKIAVDSNIFKGLENLETLYLEDNDLKSLKPGVFTVLPNLRNLYLSYNSFTELTPNFLWKADREDQKTYFFTVGLHNNQIKKILPGAFDGVDRIEELQLYTNEITQIDEESFRGPSFISCINFQNNLVEDNDILKKLPPCRQVKFGGNPLEITGVIPANLDLKNIEHISFNFCCHRLTDGKWKFDDRFKEPQMIPK